MATILTEMYASHLLYFQGLTNNIAVKNKSDLH